MRRVDDFPKRSSTDFEEPLSTRNLPHCRYLRATAPLCRSRTRASPRRAACSASPVSGEVSSMSGTVTVTELVTAASRGDQHAWNGIVERYLPLVGSVLGKFRLSEDDSEDVNQTLWL